MNKAPCKDCKYRQLGCHDYCLPFLEFKEMNETMRMRKAEGSEMAGYIIESKKRMYKRKR